MVLSKLLSTFLNWSLKVLQIFDEVIFCNHAVIGVSFFSDHLFWCALEMLQT